MVWTEGNTEGLNCGIRDTAAPPLLLLHGVVRRWQTFLPLAPTLSERWRIHALDFRGHGSSRHSAPYAVIDYAADAETVLQGLEQPAVIYGHSLGAMVAAAVASRCPDRVRALVMEDPPFHTMGSRLLSSPLHGFFTALAPLAGSPLPLHQLVRELGDQRVPAAAEGSVRIRELRDPVALRFTASSLQRVDRRVFEPILNGTWLDGYDWTAILAAVECPSLLLQADEKLGGMLTDGDAARAVEVMKDCSVVKLPCGHVMHWGLTAQVSQLTAEFLECV